MDGGTTLDGSREAGRRRRRWPARPAAVRAAAAVLAAPLALGAVVGAGGPASAETDPVATALEPASGPPAGGGTATVHGTGFSTTRTLVEWDGELLEPDEFSVTHATVTVPPHEPGVVEVHVLAGEGRSAALTYRYADDEAGDGADEADEEPEGATPAETRPGDAPRRPADAGVPRGRRPDRRSRGGAVPDAVPDVAPGPPRLAATGDGTAAGAAALLCLLTGALLVAGARLRT